MPTRLAHPPEAHSTGLQNQTQITTVEGAPSSTTKPSRPGLGREMLLAYVLLSPCALIVGLLIFVPLTLVLWDSLRNTSFTSATSHFIGLDNYLRLLSSAEFWATAGRSFAWVVASVFLQLVAGLLLALLLNRKLVGRAFFRGLFLLPWVIPVVVVSLLWKWLLNDLYGVVNLGLGMLNPDWSGIAWFSDPVLALPTVIFVNVWRGAPFGMVMMLAGLQTVPVDILEAARIDGASAFQSFIHITLPHLRKIILIVCLLFGLFNFNNFDLIYLTTQGGPLDRTMTLPVKTYEVAFHGMQVGESSAVAILMLGLLLLASTLFFRFARVERSNRQ